MRQNENLRDSPSFDAELWDAFCEAVSRYREDPSDQNYWIADRVFRAFNRSAYGLEVSLAQCGEEPPSATQLIHHEEVA